MKYKIVLIGSGNLATALGVKLMETGHSILQVYSRINAHAEQLSSILKCDFTNNLGKLNKNADIYIIAIKDDSITNVSEKLRTQLDSYKIIAHTSGINSPSLIPVQFFNRGLFYPLQSFSKTKKLDWTQIPIFIEGNPSASEVLSSLARSLTDQIYIMDDKIRSHLHLASVFANNFSNFNLIIAERILTKSAVPITVIKSLMKETINKAFSLGPKLSQTGPAKRGDASTIEKHIRLLVTEFPQYRSLYKKYSQIIEQEFKHENPGTNTTS